MKLRSIYPTGEASKFQLMDMDGSAVEEYIHLLMEGADADEWQGNTVSSTLDAWVEARIEGALMTEREIWIDQQRKAA